MAFHDLSPDNTITGASDRTEIGNVGDRLKVDAVTGSGGASGLPAIVTPQLIFNCTKVDLPAYASGYYTVYSTTDSTFLHYFAIEFNDDDVYVRLECNGTQAFEINLDCLHTYFSTEHDDDDHSGSWFPEIWAQYERHEEIFVFSPRFPVACSSGFKIQAKANSSSTLRDIEAYQLGRSAL